MSTFKVKPLSEEYAKEICDWKYEGEYAVYNYPAWDKVVKSGWAISIKEKRESEFFSFSSKDELIAYGRIYESGTNAFIGMGLKPSWCEKGYGKAIMNLLIQKCKKKYPKHTVALEVRIFNERAIKCYKDIGFEIKEKYAKKTFNGEDEFYYMEH